MGFTAILFAARLSAIDDEIYAAAELDGANHWQKMWQRRVPDRRGLLRRAHDAAVPVDAVRLRRPGPAADPGRPGRGHRDAVAGWSTASASGDDEVGYSQTIGLLLFVLGIVGLLIIRRVVPGEVLMAAIATTTAAGAARARRRDAGGARRGRPGFTPRRHRLVRAGRPVRADPRRCRCTGCSSPAFKPRARDRRRPVPADVLRRASTTSSEVWDLLNIGTAMLNSLYITAASLVLTLVIAVPASYALARSTRAARRPSSSGSTRWAS